MTPLIFSNNKPTPKLESKKYELISVCFTKGVIKDFGINIEFSNGNKIPENMPIIFSSVPNFKPFNSNGDKYATLDFPLDLRNKKDIKLSVIPIPLNKETEYDFIINYTIE